MSKSAEKGLKLHLFEDAGMAEEGKYKAVTTVSFRFPFSLFIFLLFLFYAPTCCGIAAVLCSTVLLAGSL